MLLMRSLVQVKLNNRSPCRRSDPRRTDRAVAGIGIASNVGTEAESTLLREFASSAGRQKSM